MSRPSAGVSRPSAGVGCPSARGSAPAVASRRRAGGSPSGPRYVVCGDVGSTFTKLAAVDRESGALAATAAHPTTVGTDVLHGVDAARAALAAALPGADLSDIRLCSSAGGGLRLAVVGYESLVTAEAGQRVGLSAGARVVHVAAGRLDGVAVAALRAAQPDVILLVGGTDGGDAEVIVHNAHRIATGRLRMPVVVAGNVDAAGDVAAALGERGIHHVVAANVLPRIGVLDPVPARAAIREMFLAHVIGGKKLSKGPRFASLVRAPTPDAVLTGVEVLAAYLDADLLVIDIGGATTDVYSVLSPPDGRGADDRGTDGRGAGRQGAGGQGAGGRRLDDVAGVLWHSRTVEGDLGMRWSATGVVDAARAERLDVPDGLDGAARHRAADPGFLPVTPAERADEIAIARLAALVALRRHARGEPGGEARKDLQRVRLLVCSGGVLRHAEPGDARAVLAAPLGDLAGGWPLPRRAAAVVDRDYVLAAAGLLAPDAPEAATRLVARFGGATVLDGR